MFGVNGPLGVLGETWVAGARLPTTVMLVVLFTSTSTDGLIQPEHALPDTPEHIRGNESNTE